MADLNLRRLGYFVAVAETLSFGRAAERLHIGQPVLSRQIAVLERELGAALFARSSSGTALTDAGRQILDEARELLRSAEALQRRTRQAARGVQRLALGFMPGLLVTPIAQGLRESFPGIEIDLVRTGWDDQRTTILDGRVDLGLIRLPVDATGLRIRPLFREPRVAVLPAASPLASRPELELDELAELELLQSADAVPEWRASRMRRGRPAEESAAAPQEVEVKLERVAAGLGIAVLPLSTARFYTRPDVAVRPVAGLAPSEVAAAWSQGRRTPTLDRAVELAHALRASLTTERVLDADSSPAAS